jgi:hypothetical protein
MINFVGGVGVGSGEDFEGVRDGGCMAEEEGEGHSRSAEFANQKFVGHGIVGT